ncbi:hypothetical protein KC678_00380, partial [Candidatus Dojkabacteria bacterium]|nr:hypothetical protein [Candidatus Dojkabacteria bacterium]
MYTFILIGFNILFSPWLGIQPVSAAITIDELLTAHNEQRIKAGLEPLTLSTTLSRSASDKAEVMLDLNCWSHYCPPDTEPWEYFKAVGYNYQHAGENLAEGFSTIDSVMAAWLNSPTHKENILNPNFDEIGFGFAYGTYQGKANNTIITVHFGKKFALEDILQEDIPVSDLTKQTVNKSLLLDDNYVTIDNLQDDQVVNQNIFEVSGKVNPENSQVGIVANNDIIGKVDADGESYTYRSEPDYKDGKYSITAQLYDENGQVIARSEVIALTLDGEFPILDESSINVNQTTGDSIIIDFRASKDTLTITSDASILSLQKDDVLSRWYVSFDESELFSKDTLKINLKDKSGNQSEFILNTSEIAEIVAQVKSTSTNKYSFEKDSNFLSDFFDRITSGGVRTIVPIAFTVYLFSLFMLDFIVLSKTDKLHFST